MSEDTEVVAEIPGAEAAASDSSYANVLNSEGAAEKTSDQVVDDDSKTTTQDPVTPEDPEFVLKEGMKAKLSEIMEWQKGHLLQKDYTQKTQMLSEQRKSLESAFGGRIPDTESLSNIGKFVQMYSSDPRVQQFVDAALSGQLDSGFDGTKNEQPGVSKDPYVQRLEGQLRAMSQKLEQFTGSYQEREQAKLQDQAKQTWESWISKKQQTDKTFKVSEDTDLEMGSLIPGIRARHPDWDNSKILDHSFRLATVDQQPQKIAQQILKDADDAKTNAPPKITPKSGKRADSEKSYTEILTD